MTAFFFHEEIWCHGIFPSALLWIHWRSCQWIQCSALLKNATHISPINPVEFNQSDDDLETPEMFPIYVSTVIYVETIRKKNRWIHVTFLDLEKFRTT